MVLKIESSDKYFSRKFVIKLPGLLVNTYEVRSLHFDVYLMYNLRISSKNLLYIWCVLKTYKIHIVQSWTNPKENLQNDR